VIEDHTSTPAGRAHTGRTLVLLAPRSRTAAPKAFRSVAGITPGDTVILPTLGVAIVAADPDQARALSTAATSSDRPEILVAEPERRVWAWNDYLNGYRDGVTDLADRLIGRGEDVGTAAMWSDTAAFTWGLQAMGIPDAGDALGGGSKVAVLDTGIDRSHPDVADRPGLTTQSFIEGEDADDGNGHGTHTSGTVGGPLQPAEGPRYGVAPACELFVGKVLGDDGQGSDGEILSGIEWAIGNGCGVVSMSLGAATEADEPYSTVFEAVAQRAMAAGALLVAAAGNESQRRSGVVAPVGHPANCPSIMAVGAIDASERVADFSSGTVGPVGQVDVVAPGVAVRSAWAGEPRYRALNGTSMATPHVAGVAAVLAAAHGTGDPRQLGFLLMLHARRLAVASTDVGAGLASWRAADTDPRGAPSRSRRVTTQRRAAR
jgi:subtilisin family serine protease